MIVAVPLSLRGHLVFDHADYRREYCSGNAAADRLTDDRANVHPAACVGQYRKDCCQDLTADATTNCTGDCVTKCPEVDIARCRAGGITAYCAATISMMRLIIIPDIVRTPFPRCFRPAQPTSLIGAATGFQTRILLAPAPQGRRGAARGRWGPVPMSYAAFATVGFRCRGREGVRFGFPQNVCGVARSSRFKPI